MRALAAQSAGNKAWRVGTWPRFHHVDVIDDRGVQRKIRSTPTPKLVLRTVIDSPRPPCLRAMQTPSKACKRSLVRIP